MKIENTDFSAVDELLHRSVTEGAFPGCAAATGSLTGKPRFFTHGKLGNGLGPVQTRSLYDLASLTKILGSTAVAMTLYRDGVLKLDQKVADGYPPARDAPIGRSGATMEQLLAHSSGLPTLPLFLDHPNYRDLLKAVIATELVHAPDERAFYTDLGMILFAECLVALSGLPLATLAWRQVYEPLQMRDTFYRPARTDLYRIAPTELDRNFRKRLVHGEVHDENAYVLDGVAGQAGLFSTIEDVARFARAMLRGRFGQSDFLPEAVVERFTTRRGRPKGSTRALGWDTPSEKKSSAGDLFSRRSFGHTGYTGTSIWIDPERAIFAVLLSNRVHPRRDNLKIRAVRRKFHDTVIRCLNADS